MASKPTGNPVGRPLQFSSSEEMQEKIDSFFNACIQEKEPFTVTGLCLALDLDRSTLIDYARRPAFTNTIKQAKMRIENFCEKELFSNKPNTTGVIFNLKHNFRWSDRSSIEVQTDTTGLDKEKLKNLTDEELKLFQNIVIKLQKD